MSLFDDHLPLHIRGAYFLLGSQISKKKKNVNGTGNFYTMCQILHMDIERRLGYIETREATLSCCHFDGNDTIISNTSFYGKRK